MGLRRCIGGMLCTVVVAGCSPPTRVPEQAPPASPTAAVTYDVARLSEVADDFPPGFVPYPFRVNRVRPEVLAQIGAVVSFGWSFTVAPQQCRPLLKPVDGQLGAAMNGSRADGPNKQTIGVGVDAPVTVSAGIPATGCERMTFDVPEAPVPTRGTAERVLAPDIDGAVTSALKVHTEGYSNVEYHYAAILDDRVYVTVNARVATDFEASPVLPNLLVKAVAAVRGR